MSYHHKNSDDWFIWVLLAVLTGVCWPVALVFLFAYALYDKYK